MNNIIMTNELTRLMEPQHDPADHHDALPGRCIYCDQRCNADAIYHDYCREAFEKEPGTHWL